MVFDPLKMDWAAEGGGSRSAAPVRLPRPNYGTAGPSGSLFVNPTQQINRDPRPGERPASVRTIIDTDRNRGTESGSTGGVSQTRAYPTVLPALTAEQQEALMTRRRLATRGLEETQNVVKRERERAEADTLRRQSDIAQQQRSQSREGMQTLAGRGVARSPMFTNPFQRQLAEGAQRQTAELQSGLAATLASLESALRQADIGREREVAQIDFDALSMRSDLDRLLGA
jgi:hypothetical protein